MSKMSPLQSLVRRMLTRVINRSSSYSDYRKNLVLRVKWLSCDPPSRGRGAVGVYSWGTRSPTFDSFNKVCVAFRLSPVTNDDYKAVSIPVSNPGESGHDSLLAAIQANPKDMLCLKIYADYLQDRGLSERAELVRNFAETLTTGKALVP